MADIYFHDNNNRKQQIDILFENEQMIAVNKAAGIPVIPDRFGLYKYNLRDLVAQYLLKKDQSSEAMVVHRIDADTSGVLLFAKTKEYHRRLNMMFEERKVVKKYWAIVNGQPQHENGTINHPLKNIGNNSSRMVVDVSGKEAQTHYRVLESFEHYSLLEVQPFTGRTHQIRVHLKAIGHPLAIDPLYGSAKPIDLSMIKSAYRYKRNQDPVNLCERLTLHARSLTFVDPDTGEEIFLEADLAKDLKALLNMLGKWDKAINKSDHVFMN